MKLHAVVASMIDLLDDIDDMEDSEFGGEGGKAYLVGKLDAALYLIESELMQAQKAAALTALENLFSE